MPMSNFERVALATSYVVVSIAVWSTVAVISTVPALLAGEPLFIGPFVFTGIAGLTTGIAGYFVAR